MEKRGKKREEREKKPGKEGEHFLGFDKKNRDNNIHDVAPLFPPFLSPPPKAAASPSFFSSIKEEKNVIVLKEATAFVTSPRKK